MKAGFIGAGKVGFSLGKYTCKKRHRCDRLLQPQRRFGHKGLGIYGNEILQRLDRYHRRQRYALYHGA